MSLPLGKLLWLPPIFLLQTELDVTPGPWVKLNGLTLDEGLTFHIAKGLIVDLRYELFSDFPGREQAV